MEFDIAGEYFRQSHVANCFTNVLEGQLRYAKEKGGNGISVRCNRYDHDIWGEAQEANLWFLGLRASGRISGEDEAWRTYARETFGEKAAAAMERALRPTGKAIAEALCIDAETFGDGRSKIPGFDQIKIGGRAPQGTSAFDRNWAVWRWNPSQVPAYESLKHGDPAVIARETKGLAESLETGREPFPLRGAGRDVPCLPQAAADPSHRGWSREGRTQRGDQGASTETLRP